jgi:hypothetical protein
MHGTYAAGALAASNVPVRPASENKFTVRTEETPENESDYCECFKLAARQLLGSDPGLALHVLTGISESSGYRYASGERPAPGYILWQLLRSDQGWQWLCGLMDGSNAEWWGEIKRARAIKDAIDAVPSR